MNALALGLAPLVGAPARLSTTESLSISTVRYHLMPGLCRVCRVSVRSLLTRSHVCGSVHCVVTGRSSQLYAVIIRSRISVYQTLNVLSRVLHTYYCPLRFIKHHMESAAKLYTVLHSCYAGTHG